MSSIFFNAGDTNDAEADKIGMRLGRNSPTIPYKNAELESIFVKNCHFTKF
jgi:hypothetical protein